MPVILLVLVPLVKALALGAVTRGAVAAYRDRRAGLVVRAQLAKKTHRCRGVRETDAFVQEYAEARLEGFGD